jgi:hypothetical protein
MQQQIVLEYCCAVWFLYLALTTLPLFAMKELCRCKQEACCLCVLHCHYCLLLLLLPLLHTTTAAAAAAVTLVCACVLVCDCLPFRLCDSVVIPVFAAPTTALPLLHKRCTASSCVVCRPKLEQLAHIRAATQSSRTLTTTTTAAAAASASATASNRPLRQHNCYYSKYSVCHSCYSSKSNCYELQQNDTCRFDTCHAVRGSMLHRRSRSRRSAT